jgi:hypothetical protein
VSRHIEESAAKIQVEIGSGYHEYARDRRCSCYLDGWNEGQDWQVSLRAFKYLFDVFIAESRGRFLRSACNCVIKHQMRIIIGYNQIFPLNMRS